MTIELNPISKNINVLTLPMGDILFSYKTPVAFYEMNTGNYYRTSKKWSKTTSRHINPVSYTHLTLPTKRIV